MTTAADKTLVATLNRALNGKNASAADFAAQLEKVGNIETLAKTEGDKFAALSNAEFAAKLLANLGISAATIGAESFAALEPAIIDYMGTLGAPNRGLAALQAAQLLATKADDATFGTAAKALNAAVAADAVAYDPKTFNLTTGVDTLSPTATAEASRTTANDDTINGDVASLASARTLQVTDSIDGGDGVDTLNAKIGTNFSGFTTGSLKKVEIVSLTSTAGVPVSFNATNVADVSTYNLKGDVGLAAMASAGITVNLDSAQSDVTLGFTAKAVEGTSDSLTLGLTNVGAADNATTTIDEQTNVAITADGIEALAINATGTNVVSLANGARAVTIAGSGSLKITDAGAATKTVDASTLAGALDIIFGTATNVTNVVGGTGDDVVRVDDELTATARINGGAGTNKLMMNNAGAAVTQYNMTGISTVELVNSGVLTFSAGKASGITTINVANNAAGGGLAADAAAAASTFADMGSAAITVNVTKSAAGATLASDHTGATTVNYAGVATDTATARGDSAGTVTLSKSSGLTVNVAANANLTADADITAARATSVAIVANGTLGTATAVDVSAATAATVTADFKSTSTSKVKFLAAKATNAEITTAGTLDLTGSTFDAIESLTLSTTNKAVTGVGNLPALSSATLSGTGNSAAITLGAIGTTDLAYGTSVSATGLKGGLTATTVDVGVGQSINLQVAGVTGIISLGAVTVANNATSGAYTGSATLNAKAAGGNVGVGKITAKTVNADFSSVTGTVTTADFAGDAVTVNLAGATAVAGTRNIEAKTSVAYTGQGIANDTVTIDAISTSTALTVAVTGGIGDDSFTINGGAAQASITVTGDLGSLGTDSINVSSTTTTATTQTISIAGLTNYNNATINGSDGKDTITGGADNDIITAGKGADTIALGAGSDTVIFAGTAANNGADTISTVTAGATASGGDVLDFNAILGGGAVLNTATGGVFNAFTAVALADQANGITVADQNLVIGKVTSAAAIDTAAEVVTAIANNGVLDALDFDASSKSVVILAEDNGTTAYVYFVENDAVAAIATGEVTLVGTLTTSVDFIDKLVAANFTV